MTNAPVLHVQQIVARAVNYAITNEDENTALFNQHYQYTRTQTKVYHDEAGKVTDFKQTQTQENTNAAKLNSAADSHPYQIKGRDFILKPYPITNIVRRFDFTLAGEEIVDGRRAYVISFAPPARSCLVVFICMILLSTRQRERCGWMRKTSR